MIKIMIISSISIEVNRTVFVYIFFIKDILNVKDTNQSIQVNIQPNIFIIKKASKLTFNQIFLEAKKTSK